MNSRVWGFREGTGFGDGIDLVGFHVEALDGRIGRIVHVSSDGPSTSYVVVDIGHWHFGKHVVLPAGAVSRVDTEQETVYVDRTRQEIKDAPEPKQLFRHPEDDYLDRLGGYYGKFYADGKV
jgi:hypothetical protein